MESDEQRIEVEDCKSLSFCPSLNSYSSVRFAEIAAKVTQEYADDTSNDDDDDFEFALVRTDFDVTADDIFPDGHFRPIFPVFNRDLLIREDSKADVSTTLRLPLRKLFIQERGERDPPSSSSSEADELEGLTPGTYCVWRPKVVETEASPSKCKKSSSTGSASKRWKLLDLLRRSNSEGKEAFMFLTPKSIEQKVADDSKEVSKSGDGAGKVKGKAKGDVGGGEKAASAHEVFYVRNRAAKEGDKRKSFLPYRKDLVGFFSNVNGVGKTFPPF